MGIKETREVELVAVEATDECMVQVTVLGGAQTIDVDDAVQVAEELLAAAREARQWKADAATPAKPRTEFGGAF